MPWLKVLEIYKSCLTCYVYNLLSPEIKYVRFRHKTKFQIALLILGIAKCTSKDLLISEIIIRQAETYAAPYQSN